MKGLVTDEPWISKILRGEKVWEMRTTSTSIRGRIVMFRKGSGTAVGTAELVDSIGPLDAIASRAHRNKHGIPQSQDDALLRWNHAWVLENARSLIQAVNYKHPIGAVTWVNLDDAVEQQMMSDHDLFYLAGQHRPISSPSAVREFGEQQAIAVDAQSPPVFPAAIASRSLVPVAKCGSWFGIHLARRSGFTIGAKGEEQTYQDYAEALGVLRAMRVPRWRRPNSEGDWGIVPGVCRCHPDEFPAFSHINELDS